MALADDLTAALRNAPELGTAPSLAMSAAQTPDPAGNAQALAHTTNTQAIQGATTDLAQRHGGSSFLGTTLGWLDTGWRDARHVLGDTVGGAMKLANAGLQDVQHQYRYAHDIVVRHGLGAAILEGGILAAGAGLGALAAPFTGGASLVAGATLGAEVAGGVTARLNPMYSDSWAKTTDGAAYRDPHSGLPVSPGRDIAGVLGLKEHKGLDMFNVVSGITDGLFDVTTDPLSHGLGAAKDVSTAARSVEKAEDVDRAYQASGGFRNAVEDLSKLDSGQIIKRYPKFTDLAERLGPANTPDEVKQVFKNALGAAEITGANQFMVSSVLPSRNIVTALGTQAKIAVQEQPGPIKWAEAQLGKLAPESKLAARADEEGLSAKIFRQLGNNVPVYTDTTTGMQVRGGFDIMSNDAGRVTFQTGRMMGLAHTVAEDVATSLMNEPTEAGRRIIYKNMVVNAIKAHDPGNILDPDMMKQLGHAFDETMPEGIETGRNAKYAYDINGRDLSKVMAPDGSTFTAGTQASHLGMTAIPDYDAVRQLIRGKSNFNQILGKTDDFFASHFTQGIFKPLVLIQPGTGMRIAAGEAATTISRFGLKDYVGALVRDSILKARGNMTLETDLSQGEIDNALGMSIRHRVDQAEEAGSVMAPGTVAVDDPKTMSLLARSRKGAARLAGVTDEQLAQDAKYVDFHGGTRTPMALRAGHGVAEDVVGKQAQATDALHTAFQEVPKGYHYGDTFAAYGNVDAQQSYHWQAWLRSLSKDEATQKAAKAYLGELKREGVTITEAGPLGGTEEAKAAGEAARQRILEEGPIPGRPGAVAVAEKAPPAEFRADISSLAESLRPTWAPQIGDLAYTAERAAEAVSPEALAELGPEAAQVIKELAGDVRDIHQAVLGGVTEGGTIADLEDFARRTEAAFNHPDIDTDAAQEFLQSLDEMANSMLEDAREQLAAGKGAAAPPRLALPPGPVAAGTPASGTVGETAEAHAARAAAAGKEAEATYAKQAAAQQTIRPRTLEETTQAATEAAAKAAKEHWDAQPQEVLDRYQRHQMTAVPGADPHTEWGQVIAEALKGATHTPAEQGAVPNLDLLRAIASGKIVKRQLLEEIPNIDRPLMVPGRELVPDMGGTVQKIANWGHRRFIEPIVNGMARDPAYRLEWDKQFAAFKPMVEAGEMHESEAMQYASQRAAAMMRQFIHNPMERSLFSKNVTNWIPFYFAQEQAYRRAGRLLLEDPGAFRKYQLSMSMLHDVAHPAPDQNGQPQGSILMPGTGFLGKYVPAAMNVLGFHTLGSVPVGFAGSLQSLQTVSPLVEDPSANFGPLAVFTGKTIAHIFPESTQFVDKVIGPEAAAGSAWDTLIPNTTLRRVWAAQRMDSRSNQAAMMNIIQLEAYKQEQAQARYITDHPEPAVGTPEHDTWVANQPHIIPGPNASAMERQQFLDRVKNHTRILDFLKAAVGFVSPMSPQYRYGDAQISEDLRTSIKNAGNIGEGITNFLQAHPGATPYTVFQSQAADGSPIQASHPAQQWIDQNLALIQKYPAAAFYLTPQSNAKFDSAVYNEQLAMGLRQKRTPEEFLKQVYIAQGNSGFYDQDRPAYNKALVAAKGDKTKTDAIKANWSAYVQAKAAANPVWYDDYTSKDRQNARTQALSQLQDMFAKDQAPPGTQTDAVKGLLDDFNTYQAASLPGRRDPAAVEHRKTLDIRWEKYLDGLVTQHPELSAVVNRLFRSMSEADRLMAGLGEKVA